MVGVSKEWRAAVTNESWCRVTCMRFPRVVAIVTALELETPVYREVYREQLACTVPAATSLVAAALQSSRATTTCRHQKCIPFGHVYQTSIKPSVYNIVLTSTLNLRVLMTTTVAFTLVPFPDGGLYECTSAPFVHWCPSLLPHPLNRIILVCLTSSIQDHICHAADITHTWTFRAMKPHEISSLPTACIIPWNHAPSTYVPRPSIADEHAASALKPGSGPEGASSRTSSLSPSCFRCK
jgi:hypothetical protein